MTATTGPPATKPAEIAAQVRYAVLRLSRRLRQHAAAGVTPSQLSALHTLARDERMTLRQLADAERVQPPSITRIVDSLVAAGLVTRTPDERDRRVGWVELTAEGRSLVETVRRRRDAYLAQRLRSFTPDELALLARATPLLERLTEDVEP